MPDLQNSKSTLDFLGTIASNDRGDDVALGHTAQAIVKLGQFLIDKATENLDRGGNLATGGTASSMNLVNLNVETVRMSVDVEILSTYKFLDQGVRGTKGGTGKYQFRTPYANKRMATAILKWLRKRGIRGGGYAKKYQPYKKLEKKDVEIHKQVSEAENFKRLAYAVASNIKQKGIRPTKFFTNAVKATQAEQKKMLAAGFRLDIIETLKRLN